MYNSWDLRTMVALDNSKKTRKKSPQPRSVGCKRCTTPMTWAVRAQFSLAYSAGTRAERPSHRTHPPRASRNWSPGIRHCYGLPFAVLRALALTPVWLVAQPSADIPPAQDCCAVRRTWNLSTMSRRCVRCRRCAGFPRELCRRSRRLPRTVTARHVAS